MFPADHQQLEIRIVLIGWPQGFLHFGQFQLTRSAPGGKQTDQHHFPFQAFGSDITIALRFQRYGGHIIAQLYFICIRLLRQDISGKQKESAKQ